MKTIIIEDDLYAYIASQTQEIGEDASHILRRLLLGNAEAAVPQVEESVTESTNNTDNETAAPQADNSVSKESLKDESVFTLLATHQFDESSSRVEVFLTILSALYKTNRQTFDKVLSVKGRNRIYFSTSKEELLKAGSSTNPKQVPDSNYWVVTNNNTAKKVSMLTQVVDVLGYSEQDTVKLAKLFAPELHE